MTLTLEEYRLRKIAYVAFKMAQATAPQGLIGRPMINAATWVIAAVDAAAEFAAAYATDLPKFRRLLLESGQKLDQDDENDCQRARA